MEDYPSEKWLEDRFFNDCDARELFGCVGLNVDPKSKYQRQVPTAAGIADLIVVSEHRVTIIELKRVADEQAIAQVLRYRGAVLPVVSEHVDVQCIVCAFEATPGAAFAASATDCVALVIATPRLSFAWRIPPQDVEFPDRLKSLIASAEAPNEKITMLPCVRADASNQSASGV